MRHDVRQQQNIGGGLKHINLLSQMQKKRDWKKKIIHVVRYNTKYNRQMIFFKYLQHNCTNVVAIVIALLD